MRPASRSEQSMTVLLAEVIDSAHRKTFQLSLNHVALLFSWVDPNFISVSLYISIFISPNGSSGRIFLTVCKTL